MSDDLIGIAPRIDIPLGGRVHKYFPLALNKMSAPFFKNEIQTATQKLDSFSKKLTIAVTDNHLATPGQIPKVLHFISLSPQPRPFPFYAKMAVGSALSHNPGWTVFFHCTHKPTGPYWQAIESQLVINSVPDFDFFGPAPVRHYAHKADVIRLLALKYMGGAYLDLDTLTLRSFEPLRQNSFVMGVQPSLPGQPGGLCNAIMFGQAGSQFIDLWLHEFPAFRSRGTDWLWDFMSVKTPALLARKYPSLITVLKPEALFLPLWDQVDRRLFAENGAASLPNYAVHLWGNWTKDRLEALDESFVRYSNSLYAKLARPVQEALQ